MTATAINTVITKFYSIIGTREQASKQSLFRPHPHTTDTCVLIVERQQKSLYTTHNHNIMVIFFEFNLNILNFLSLRLLSSLNIEAKLFMLSGLLKRVLLLRFSFSHSLSSYRWLHGKMGRCE